ALRQPGNDRGADRGNPGEEAATLSGHDRPEWPAAAHGPHGGGYFRPVRRQGPAQTRRGVIAVCGPAHRKTPNVFHGSVMNLFEKYQRGLSYSDFIARYANDAQKQRWQQMHAQVSLTTAQKNLLGSFTRPMPVMVLAGAWCGDCINQCPIHEHFAAATSVLTIRYLDRDEHADVPEELQICGGRRVPVLVFFAEDGFEVARYGERILSQYRQM